MLIVKLHMFCVSVTLSCCRILCIVFAARPIYLPGFLPAENITAVHVGVWILLKFAERCDNKT